MSIYEQMKLANVPLAHHESDLYVKSNSWTKPNAWRIKFGPLKQAEFPVWETFAVVWQPENIVSEQVAANNKADFGNRQWVYQAVSPTDFDYPHLLAGTRCAG